MAFFPLKARSTECHTLIERHIVPDLSSLADHDTNPVINEKFLPNFGARVDVYARELAADLRKVSWYKGDFQNPEKVGNTIN